MEVEKLQQAIDRIRKSRSIANEKALLLWGGRTYTWTQMVMPKMTRQLHWLDSNLDHEKYEERFTEWETSLREYERACTLLEEAKAI